MTVSLNEYYKALSEELLLAMGCTEPIALAYASAVVAERLGGYPEAIDVEVSRNIVKNVKSVIVPNTGGLYGIEAAVIAGMISARPEEKLQVLAALTPVEQEVIQHRMSEDIVRIRQTQEPDVFFIKVGAIRSGKSVSVTIRTDHTNITEIVENGRVVFEKSSYDTHLEKEEKHWSLPELIQATRTMDLEPVRALLERQLQCNMAIAAEGLKGQWGAGIGKVLLQRAPEDIRYKIRAWAAAGSDARMNGCEMPVVIVSGSGNQGITASVPVAVFAQELGSTQEQTLRALLLSDLVTIALKQGIGKLSAYCGAVSAGCGSGAAIAMLKGYTNEQIQEVISNALAISSGLLCDGAKSSCAAKISMSLEGALLALDMVADHHVFRAGDGIVQENVDATAATVGRIASLGMVGTDQQIIREMLHEV